MIITIAGVIKEFNSIVESYLKEGYTILPLTMRSTLSGAVSYVDLVNLKEPNHVLRVWLSTSYARRVNYEYVDTLSITVKRYRCDDALKIQSIYLTDVDPIVNKIYYTVVKDKVFSDSMDEINRIEELRTKRSAKSIRKTGTNKKEIDISKLPDKFIDSIMSRVNNIRGFKRANATCIREVMYLQYFSQREDRGGFNGKVRATIDICFNGNSTFIRLG